MKYRIVIHTLEEVYIKKLGLNGGERVAEKETRLTVSFALDCKDAEEVLKEIPALLDLIPEGTATSIKITEQ